MQRAFLDARKSAFVNFKLSAAMDVLKSSLVQSEELVEELKPEQAHAKPKMPSPPSSPHEDGKITMLHKQIELSSWSTE